MTKVEGCTSGKVQHDHTRWLIQAFRLMWIVQGFGHSYLLFLQVAVYVTCRLLFLHFQCGHQHTGTELCWHIFRGVFWSCATFTLLWTMTKGRRKVLKVVARRRLTVTVRATPGIKQSTWFFAFIILNGNAMATMQGAIPYGEGISSFQRESRIHEERTNVERSWTVTYDGMPQDQRNGTMIVPTNDPTIWTRVSTDTVPQWLTSDSYIALHGHIFKDVALGMRRTQSHSLHPTVVQHKAREIWADHCGDICTANLVERQPPRQGRHNDVHYIVELTHRNPAYLYFLADVYVADEFVRRTTVAAHHLLIVTDVIDTVFTQDECQPNGVNLCTLIHNSRHYRRHQEPRLPHAAYIQVQKHDLVATFAFHPNLVGLHQLAIAVFEGPSGGFTTDAHRIQHQVRSGHSESVCFTEFRGQDLLWPETFLRTITCVDIARYFGRVEVVFEREQEVAFTIFWDDGDMDVTSLQQTAIYRQILKVPEIPKLHIRYDPEEFDQERDTVLDAATYPLPEDANDEVALPPRHRWRNHQEVMPVLEAATVAFPTGIRLDTYGLHDRYISNRLIEVREFNPPDILRSIATTWAEYAFQAHMNVYYVAPQPDGTPPSTIVLVVEFPTGDVDLTRARAVLIDCEVDGTPSRRQAEYVDQITQAKDVARVIDQRRCQPTGIDTCYVHSRANTLAMHEEMLSTHGDYKVLRVQTFERINSHLSRFFPSASVFAGDFRWRSNHYDRTHFTIFIYSIVGQDRIAPIHVERDISNFRDVHSIWVEVLAAGRQHGASERSVLHHVRPQNIFHAEQTAMHLILDVYPNFPLTPVLVTVIVQIGGLRAQRVEIRAWQLPPRLSVLHMMTLVGYASFSREFAVDAHISHARQQFRGDDQEIQLVTGGNYELRFTVPAITDFISAVAAFARRQDMTPAEDSESETFHESDDMELLQLSLDKGPVGLAETTTSLVPFSMQHHTALRHESRQEPPLSLCTPVSGPHVPDRWCALQAGGGTTSVTPDEHQGISLLQQAVRFAVVHSVAASFTDEFFDLVWPLTTRGEGEISAAGDIDPNLLRDSWRLMEQRNGLLRPVSLSTYFLHRPPTVRSGIQPLEITVARFDDPLTIPQEISRQWPDLQMSTWKLSLCHSSISSSRTWEGVTGSHFVLLNGRELAASPFAAGIIKLVATSPEDESSMLFSAVVPAATTWLHIYNWLRIGPGFPLAVQYRVEINGEHIRDPYRVVQVSNGFFVQIFAKAPDLQSYVGIPAGKARLVPGELCFGLPSDKGVVCRAAPNIQGSSCVRLPLDGRSAAISRKWPDLVEWTTCRLHHSGRGRSPPWHTLQDAVLLNPAPTGNWVTVLVAVFEGGGCQEYALLLQRVCHLSTLYQTLECSYRCQSPQYTCHTTVNFRPVSTTETFDLEAGDYIEVFISLTDARELQLCEVTARDQRGPSVADGEEIDAIDMTDFDDRHGRNSGTDMRTVSEGYTTRWSCESFEPGQYVRWSDTIDFIVDGREAVALIQLRIIHNVVSTTSTDDTNSSWYWRINEEWPHVLDLWCATLHDLLDTGCYQKSGDNVVPGQKYGENKVRTRDAISLMGADMILCIGLSALQMPYLVEPVVFFLRS